MHIAGMDGFRDLLGYWTPLELSEDLGVPYHTAASMKRRGWIAAKHWAALLVAANRKNLPLNEAMLVRFTAERKPSAVGSERAA
jgi:hypothetical protein